MSLLLETSLKNKYLPDPPVYINVTIKADDATPSNIFKNKSLIFTTQFLYILINTSIKKYESNEANTQKLGAPLLNIGNDKYIIVKAKTKELNVGLPYLLY
jgi:hypothetical protein